MVRKKNNSSGSTPFLDLHGVTHSAASDLVEDFVLLRTPPVRIITGHSKAMKDIVKKVLEKHDYKFADGEFHGGSIMVLS